MLIFSDAVGSDSLKLGGGGGGVNKGMEGHPQRDGQSQGAILFVFCSYLILD